MAQSLYVVHPFKVVGGGGGADIYSASITTFFSKAIAKFKEYILKCTLANVSSSSTKKSFVPWQKIPKRVGYALRIRLFNSHIFTFSVRIERLFFTILWVL